MSHPDVEVQKKLSEIVTALQKIADILVHVQSSQMLLFELIKRQDKED